MYTPPYARMSSHEAQHAVMRTNGFAVLVTPGSDGVHISHLPLFLDSGEGKLGTLYGHVARANGHWMALTDNNESCAVFSGPHGYISPLWQGQPEDRVPTWNYTAVHAFGAAELIDGEMATEVALSRLTSLYEGSEGWSINQLSDKKREQLLASIVAFKIEIRRIEGKLKLSQNRSPEDQSSIISKLNELGETQLAEAMQSTR